MIEHFVKNDVVSLSYVVSSYGYFLDDLARQGNNISITRIGNKGDKTITNEHDTIRVTALMSASGFGFNIQDTLGMFIKARNTSIKLNTRKLY